MQSSVSGTQMDVPMLPFKFVWGLTAFILNAAGRFVALLIGVVFMIVGVVLTLTVLGAIIGVPMALFGFALVMRGLF